MLKPILRLIMKIKILITSIILFQNFCFAQIKLKIGDKAPLIYVESYLKNKPKNTDLKNKYILLEFWATWCKSCLEEVPKINDLAERYADRNDIVFISITDEKPKKTKSTLDRIDFKSIVISDTTLKTHKNYIMNRDGGYSIPQTFLIDQNGIIRWMGITMKLNPELFKKFIENVKIEKDDETAYDIPTPTFTK